MVNQGDNSSYICVGIILSAHGVKGEVKVHPYTQNPEDLTAYGPLFNQSGSKEFQLRIKRIQNDAVIATISGCNDRNAAEPLRGTKLYIPRDALPETDEDEFYHEDLLNLKVIRQNGTLVGTIKAIHNFGAGDVLEVTLSGSGKTEMIPFTKAVIPDINLAEGFVTMTPPEELIAKEGHD